jgi:hypothetical protein
MVSSRQLSVPKFSIHFLFLPSVLQPWQLSLYSAGLRAGRSGFDSRRGLGIFLFTTAALGPTQRPIQWVPGTLFLGVKRPGREADHSPPSSAEVKECMELYLHSPNIPPWRGAQLKAQGQLYLYIYVYHPCYIPRPFILLDLIIPITFGEGYKFLSM